MKKKKNAFTLIELLAIIVILAIIAVITVPIILNIIENSRKGAATDSAYGYKDAVNKWYVTKLQEDNQFQLASSYTISSDGKLGDIVIPISGDKPSGGYLNYSNNSLTGGCLVFGDYAVTFEGGNATSTIKGTCSSSNEQGNGGSDDNNDLTTYTVYNPGTLIYFDPVNNETCDSTTFNLANVVKWQWNDEANNGDGGYVTTGTSTCYKWRVISVGDTESNSTITLQLDHNILNGVSWNSESDEGRNYYGPKTLLQSLATPTSTWERVPLLNYTYDTTLVGTNIFDVDTYTGHNYGILSCTNGICTTTCDENDTGEQACVAGTMNTTPLRARVITGEEVKALTMNAGAANNSLAGTWALSSSYTDGFYFSSSMYNIGTWDNSDEYNGDTSLSWMLENMGNDNNESGATEDEYSNYNANKYWTLSPTTDSSGYSAWYVEEYGVLDSYYEYSVTDAGDFCVRPVIEISKTLLGE